MSDSDHAYNPMGQALALQPPTSHDEPAVPPSQVEEEDESSLGSRAAMQRVMAEIPKKFHAKVATLGHYLKAHPNLIRVTPTGRPIVAGKEIPRAHIMDIMRSLYLWPKSQALPSGVKEVIEALHAVGAPSHLLSNSAVRTMYHSLYEAAEQPHPETEEQEPEREEEEQELGEKRRKKRTTPFKTPLHSSMPPLPAVPKVEERVADDTKAGAKG